MHGPDLRDDGADGEWRVQPWRLRLSERAVRDIAEQIARAMTLPPPDDQSTWILSRAAELPAEDEERVVRALEQRGEGARPERPR